MKGFNKNEKNAINYMNLVINIIFEKYKMTIEESTKLVKKSFLYYSLLYHIEETLHDDVESNADIIYSDFINKK